MKKSDQQHFILWQKGPNHGKCNQLRKICEGLLYILDIGSDGIKVKE